MKQRMSMTDLAVSRTTRKVEQATAAGTPPVDVIVGSGPRLVPVDQILSSRDIAAVLGIDRGAASMIVTRSSSNGFPAPITKTAAGRLWDRREVEAWGRRNGHLQ